MPLARPLNGQGSNSSLVGDFNARVILTALRRRGPATTADLARNVGLTHTATSFIVRRLEEGGLVRRTGKRQGGRGQPATILELDPDGAFSIGVRLDRAVLETVLVDLAGRIVARHTRHTLPEPAAAVAHLAGVVARMADGLGAGRDRLAGIGLAAPYNLGSWLRELDLPPAKFRRWDGFDLPRALAEATGHQVVVENDGSAAAIGELIYGHGRDLADFLYVFVGPAIGGGVVLGGDYLRGARRNSADIGVIPVQASRLAPLTGDGHTILMARASLAALGRHLRAHGANLPRGRLSEAQIAAHRPLFDAWAEDAADAMALPILTGAHLLDVGHVVLGGDLPGSALSAIGARLAVAMGRLVAESRTPPSVLAGEVGPWAAAVGAASLPLHDSYSPARDNLTRPTPQPMEARP